MDRRALGLLGLPLLVITVWCVYKIGQQTLWVSVPLMVLLVWNISRTDDRTLAEEMEAWRKTSGKRKARVVAESYRTPAVVRNVDRRDLAREKVTKGAGDKVVVPPPWELTAMLELAGGGTQVGVYQLLPKLAYVIAAEADGVAGSDYVAVVAKLEAKHVQLLVRPRIPEDVSKGPAVISKDAAFRDAFWVECADVKAARDLLSEGIRETLRDLDGCWLFVRSDSMALVRYGHIDAGRVRALVAGADEIFAELGADGGPSLLGEDAAAAAGAKLVPARA